jgi:hypothetical protein
MSISIVTALADWSSLPVEGVKAYVGKDRSSTGLLATHHALRQFATDKCVPLDVADSILQTRLHELRAVESAKAEELRVAADAEHRAAEEIRKAEKAVAVAAAAVRIQAEYEDQRLRAIRERRAAQTPVILAALERHPTFRTLCHNFEDDAELFVAYTEHRTSGKRELRIFSRHGDWLKEEGKNSNSGPPPAPASWAAHYVLGKTPFLAACPTCGKGPQICGVAVECYRHYKWDSATGQHFRWEELPASAIPAPTPTPADQFIPSFRTLAPEGRWIPWEIATRRAAPTPPPSLSAASAVAAMTYTGSSAVRKAIPKKIRGEAWKAQFGSSTEGSCYCCRKELDIFDDWHAGHIVPAARGGPDTADNLRPLCGSCNLAMGTEHMDLFKVRCYPG